MGADASDVLIAIRPWRTLPPRDDDPYAFDASVKASSLSPDEQALTERLQQMLKRLGGNVETMSDARAVADAVAQTLTPHLRARFLAWLDEALDAVHLPIDPIVAIEYAQQWLNIYISQASQRIGQTTAQRIADVQAMIRDLPRVTTTEMATLLEPIVGRRRAETIAITELTAASSAATTAAQRHLASYGLESIQIWRTANDDRVCPVCGPRNGKRQGDGWDTPPPAHARCRCFTTLELQLPEARR